MFVCVVHNYLQTFPTYLRIYKLTFHKQHMNECSHVNLLSHHKNIISFVTMLQIMKLWKIWTPWFSSQLINTQLNDFAIEFNTIKEEFMLTLEPLRFCVFIHVVQPHTKHFMHIVGTIFIYCEEICFLCIFVRRGDNNEKISTFMKRLFSLLH